MKKIITFILSLSIAALANSFTTGPTSARETGHSQVIIQAGSHRPFNGPEQNFTGNVNDPLFQDNDPSEVSGAYVTFEPKARSAWHIHPAGQRLIVTAGVCRTQEQGGAVAEVGTGGVIWCPSGVKHWHGASADAPMTHMSLTKAVDGKNVEWMEKVNDEQYYSKTGISEAKNIVSNDRGLNVRQEKIAVIGAFTARGDMTGLKKALSEGLNADLTISEIKEVLVQMYAYAGFPRSLNGINAFMEVLQQRQANGFKDKAGKEASPLPSDKTSLELGTEIQTKLLGSPAKAEYISFAPVIDKFLKAHLFGDIFGRDNLDVQSREIATIAALSCMNGVEPQLQGHFNVGLNIGINEEQLRRLIAVIEKEIGKIEAANASKILEKVLNSKKIKQ